MMERRPGVTLMTFKQRERAIGMLTAGKSARDAARDAARHFQLHESTINSTIEQISANGERHGPIQIRQTA